MSYKKRILGPTIRQVSREFPVLLLSGPRQIGKTTLLEACIEGGRGYVTLDDLEQRELAQKDPALFLQTHKPPVIQYLSPAPSPETANTSRICTTLESIKQSNKFKLFSTEGRL